MDNKNINNKAETHLYENLPEVERESWIKFHIEAYEDDLNHAEKVLTGFPRWSIISGYYAMHDITKLYLGKIHSIKITGENIHTKTLNALNEFIKSQQERKKVIELLRKAETSFFNVIKLQEKALPLMLRKGKTERGRTQYYSKDFSGITSQRAIYFFDNIVKPYISIMECLIAGGQ